ncbi:MAG: hypothetical protein CMH57_03605 [Myxococcales bacterium]|nr:hypothetical protein [Myxococcales bacterium]
MSTETPDRDAFSTPLALALLLALGLVVLPLAQARFGLWEPWETTWAEIARAMRESGEWFNPQLGGRAAPRSLLTIWLIGLGQALGGGAEWLMRFPMGLAVTGGGVALFAWLREPFGDRRGFIAALAAMTCPQIVLSATTLAGNGVFVGLFMAIVAVYGLLVGRAADNRPVWLQALLAALLGLAVLSWGLWGLFLPLALAVALGLTQLAEGDPEAETPRGVLIGATAGALALTAGLLGWGAWQEWNPKASQILMGSVPGALLLAGVVATHRTPAMKALGKVGAGLCLALPLGAAALMASMYGGDAGGAQGFAAFELLLENHLATSNALPRHVTFDFWVRQVGFAAFPWVLLGPFGLILMVRPDEGANNPPMPPADASLRPLAPLDSGRLVALWFIVSALVIGVLGTLHERYLFPGIGALGVAGALMLTDDALWQRLRSRPLRVRVMGFAMVLMALFLCKDLDRYPKELLGPLLTDGSLELPESFSYGASLKVMRYAIMGAIAVFTFSVASTAIRWYRRLIKKQPTEAQLAQAREHLPSPTTGDEPNPIIEADIRAHTEGHLGTGLRLLEVPSRFALLFAVLALAFTVLMGFHWVPKLSNHLTLKGLIDTYQERDPGGEQPLYTYQMGTPNTSYYLSGYEPITLTKLKSQFKDESRFFMIFPRDRLGSLNYEIRRSGKPRRNVHVIDDSSSRFLLASNILGEGETEMSPIAHAIVDGKPKPAISTIFKDAKGVRQYPQFDGRVQMIGVEVYHTDEVDRWGNPTPEAQARLQALLKEGKLPSFRLGEVMVMRYYFKVLKRVSSSYQIFLHVDYPGNRINGDHHPVDGTFTTNHWIPGDYVVDTQRLLVDHGSNVGRYTMYMGFFLGSRRMKVTPRSAHDGQNRVNLGQVEITRF